MLQCGAWPFLQITKTGDAVSGSVVEISDVQLKISGEDLISSSFKHAEWPMSSNRENEEGRKIRASL